MLPRPVSFVWLGYQLIVSLSFNCRPSKWCYPLRIFGESVVSKYLNFDQPQGADVVWDECVEMSELGRS